MEGRTLQVGVTKTDVSRVTLPLLSFPYVQLQAWRAICGRPQTDWVFACVAANTTHHDWCRFVYDPKCPPIKGTATLQRALRTAAQRAGVDKRSPPVRTADGLRHARLREPCQRGDGVPDDSTLLAAHGPPILRPIQPRGDGGQESIQLGLGEVRGGPKAGCGRGYEARKYAVVQV